MQKTTCRLTWPSILMLLAFVGFSCPASAQLFYPETATLKNGMQVVVLPNHRAPVVMHMVWVRAGAIDEAWGKSGIAHFLEHLLFKGTPRHPEGEYSRLIAEMGGRENAFTSYDYTAYHAMIGKEFLPQLMALEADRLMHWRVNDEQVARERDVVLKERQQITENNPVAAFFEEVNAVMYPNHPYQRPVIGWREEIEKLNRHDAEAFVHNYYVPENMILVISGDVTLAEILPLASKYYGVMPRRSVKTHEIPQVAVLNGARRIEKESPLVRETVWSKHVLMPPARNETILENDAVSVLQKILGDARIGRLYRRLVVQDKIATSASISYRPVARGMVRFSFVVVPHKGVSPDRIDAAIDEEIALILRDGISADELKNAVQAMEVEAIYARDFIAAPARIVGMALATGLDLDVIEDTPQRLKSITVENVTDAARRVFLDRDDWVTAIISPLDISPLDKSKKNAKEE